MNGVKEVLSLWLLLGLVPSSSGQAGGVDGGSGSGLEGEGEEKERGSREALWKHSFRPWSFKLFGRTREGWLAGLATFI